MNCMHAQQLLSEAMDDRSVDTTLLAEARVHCASCAECAAFAHGLALLERAETPNPGPALADAVVAAIRATASASPTAEATASDSGESAATGGAATAAAIDLEAGSGAPSADSTRSSRRTPDASTGATAKWRYWNTLAWVGAAAAVLVVAGFATVAGVRSILAPTPSSRESASVAQDTGTSPGYDDSLAATAPKAAPAQSSPGFITMDGAAYRYVGIADIERSALTTVGSTTTALDTGGAARTYTIYSTGIAGRVAVLSAEGTRVFELVTRRLSSQVYVLTSETITDFTEWPGLPPGFPQPTAADGAPTFVAAGTDDLGVNAYSRPGTPIETGFAVAPGTPMSDPATGNPNWTWWAKPQ
jgi:hypothetical protein